MTDWVSYRNLIFFLVLCFSEIVSDLDAFGRPGTQYRYGDCGQNSSVLAQHLTGQLSVEYVSFYASAFVIDVFCCAVLLFPPSARGGGDPTEVIGRAMEFLVPKGRYFPRIS